jgi:hypothetical protein
MERNLKSLRSFIKSQKGATFEVDPALYPWYSLEYGASSTIRLLPDGNLENQAPWATKKLIPCTFSDPEDETKTVYFNIPCLEMYEKNVKCPALAPVRDIYAKSRAAKANGNSKDFELFKGIGSRHWLDQTFYHAGLILKSGVVEKDRPSDISPIRVAAFSKQIQGVIETALGLVESDDAPPSQFKDEELPCGTFSMTDIDAVLSGEVSEDEMDNLLAKFVGYPLVLVKKKKTDGSKEFANWESSFFQMRDPHELDVDDLNAIKKFGLPDLSKYLPARPTDAQYEVMVEMVKASIASEPWNPEWEEAGLKFFRKKGSGAETTDTTSTPDNSIASRVKANLGGGESSSSSSLSSALNRRRTTTTAPAVEETSPEPETNSDTASTETQAEPEETKTEVKPATTARRDPKAMAAMVKAKIGA